MSVCGSGLGVPILIHLNEHDARLIKTLVERAARGDQAGPEPVEWVGGQQWWELARDIARQIEANYERYFAAYTVGR